MLKRSKLTLFLKDIADARWFQNLITFAILVAGVVVGIETYPSMVERHGGVLHFLNEVILWLFVVEVVVKIGAEGKRPWRYFYDPSMVRTVFEGGGG